MTPEQTKKYEEAAKEYALEDWRKDHTVNVPEATKYFLAGASYASQDTEERVRQAHNAAIDKAIDLLGRRVGFGYLEENWDSVKAEIQKLKL